MNSVQITKNATPPRGAWRRVAGWAMEGGKVRGLYPPPRLLITFRAAAAGAARTAEAVAGRQGMGGIRDQWPVRGRRDQRST